MPAFFGPGPGSAYLILGQASPTSLDLANLGAAGVRIDGAADLDGVGNSVAGAGDVERRRRADVLVGAPDADPVGRPGSGSAYTMLGFGVPELAYPALTATAGVPIIPLAPTLRRTGPASFQVAPPLPPGLSLDPVSGVISGTPESPPAPSVSSRSP